MPNLVNASPRVPDRGVCIETRSPGQHAAPRATTPNTPAPLGTAIDMCPTPNLVNASPAYRIVGFAVRSDDADQCRGGGEILGWLASRARRGSADPAGTARVVLDQASP
ncbi:hypothetical protein GCM10010109_86200 [Actinoplanes campanulatus]|nr:hypothetical protein GCM10010109_86200 [Actinoplanes campanulatus]GID41665.1 hypothetical protein Aca09nite_81710 [Actinoplanes campanulatus]